MARGQWLRCKDIESRSCYATILQRIHQGVLVHDRPAAYIHQYRRRLHESQLMWSDEVFTQGTQWQLKRYYVDNGQQLLQGYEGHLVVTGPLGRGVQCPGYDFHSKALSKRYHTLPDWACPNDPKNLTMQLTNDLLGPFSTPDGPIKPGYPVGHRQCQGDGLLSYNRR